LPRTALSSSHSLPRLPPFPLAELGARPTRVAFESASSVSTVRWRINAVAVGREAGRVGLECRVSLCRWRLLSDASDRAGLVSRGGKRSGRRTGEETSADRRAGRLCKKLREVGRVPGTRVGPDVADEVGLRGSISGSEGEGSYRSVADLRAGRRGGRMRAADVVTGVGRGAGIDWRGTAVGRRRYLARLCYNV
jgi:hypothetical protein